MGGCAGCRVVLMVKRHLMVELVGYQVHSNGNEATQDTGMLAGDGHSALSLCSSMRSNNNIVD